MASLVSSNLHNRVIFLSIIVFLYRHLRFSSTLSNQHLHHAASFTTSQIMLTFSGKLPSPHISCNIKYIKIVQIQMVEISPLSQRPTNRIVYYNFLNLKAKIKQVTTTTFIVFFFGIFSKCMKYFRYKRWFFYT